jgi:hypothetical protein
MESTVFLSALCTGIFCPTNIHAMSVTISFDTDETEDSKSIDSSNSSGNPFNQRERNSLNLYPYLPI